MLRRFTMVLCALGFVCLCAGAVSATSYTFYDLSASGETTSRAYGINNNNVVVGYHQVTGTGYQTLVWNNGTKSYLAPLSGTTVVAWGVDDSGVLTGLSASANGNQAFTENINGTNGTSLYSKFSGVTVTGSRAYAINSSGAVAGYGTISGTSQGFYWDGNASDNATMLYGLSGATASTYWGLNNSGLVVGYNTGTWTTEPDPGTYDRPLAWQNGSYIDLEPLIFSTLESGGSCSGRALAVNNSNQIVGYYQPGLDSGGEPFLYDYSTSGSTVVGLGNLGADGAHAEAINDNGYVVGYGETAGGQQHAFLWSPTNNNAMTGSMVDLNSLPIASQLPSGYYFYDAASINDSGSICGTMFNGSTFRAFVLAAPLVTPEPSTLLLAASGLVGLLAYAWRKRK